MKKIKTIELIKLADRTESDWLVPIIESITDKYAQVYIQCTVDTLMETNDRYRPLVL